MSWSRGVKESQTKERREQRGKEMGSKKNRLRDTRIRKHNMHSIGIPGQNRENQY